MPMCGLSGMALQNGLTSFVVTQDSRSELSVNKAEAAAQRLHNLTLAVLHLSSHKLTDIAWKEAEIPPLNKRSME